MQNHDPFLSDIRQQQKFPELYCDNDVKQQSIQQIV